MSAAMAVLRRDFGEDALILGSRSLRGGGVEITVAREEAEEDAGPPVSVLSSMEEGQASAQRSLPEWHGFDLPELAAGASPEREAMILGQYVRFGGLSLAREETPLVVCGVPGGGKTLAVTRLATRMVLSGRDPLVVTMDTERSGAFEQLAACMKILGVELRAVDTPMALKALYAHEGQRRMMLVDTFGVSPWDGALLDRLNEIKAAVSGSLAVVHPAGGHADETCEVLSMFQALGAQNTIVSKADCCRRMGGIVQAGLRGVPLAEISTGRSVIEGLQPLTPAILRQVLVRMRDRVLPFQQAVKQEFPVRPQRAVSRHVVGKQDVSRAKSPTLSPSAAVMARHMLAQGRVQ
ncbi:flagellar GTP-binding protein FlhF [Neokomagataea tanensis]|uniref:Flagellar GTP-binding protein FlhF n=1 Tax=Neokomagataea tanensis TaxID=661191 RepID=A0A4Y6V783_9PROT|nr:MULTISPECIES: flagellar GTP-binding protein FlhF [Neokomagataea]QDH24530.1 flagellar GTP-binding protein FlhF [Neokomagataea tanensis]